MWNTCESNEKSVGLYSGPSRFFASSTLFGSVLVFGSVACKGLSNRNVFSQVFIACSSEIACCDLTKCPSYKVVAVY